MKKNYLATIGLKIPQNSLSFWEQRLTENKIPFNKKKRAYILVIQMIRILS